MLINHKRLGAGLGPLLLALLAAASSAQAQWAPTGYTGAINTPSADALPLGAVNLGWTNNIPEKTRQFPDVGHFGSLGLGMGVLPGLELSARLAYDGDLSCNQYVAGCRSWTRDLSLGGKYQLPLELPLNSRIALGVSDFGGAATNFRQSYAVWTARQGALDVSLGYGRGHSHYPLLDGGFGSLAWWATPQTRLVLEHDGHEPRAGLDWVQPLGERWRVVGSLSRKLAQERETQRSQVSVNLVYAWERDHNAQQLRRYNPLASTPEAQAGLMVAAPRRAAPETAPETAPEAAQAQQPKAGSPTANTATAVAAPSALDVRRSRAQALAQAMQQHGFTQVKVGLSEAAAGVPEWRVQGNPTAWRKSQTVALAQGLRAVLKGLREGESLVLALSYAGLPHRFVRITTACGQGQGQQRCWSHGDLAFEVSDVHSPATTPVQWLVAPEWHQQLQADVELGPGLRYTAGTEYGLFDYSLALDAGWEVPVPGVPGLLWQGSWTQPLGRSDDYRPGQVFANSNIERQVQQNLLTWVGQPLAQTFVQASAGYINPTERGGQIDVAWLSRDARLKLLGTTASYSDPRYAFYKHEPRYAQARYELVPGLWAMQLTAGQFLAGDKGWQLSSQHGFSSYRLALHYRQSQSPEAGMPLTKFAGFTFSLPIGPERSAQWGPLSLRGRDLWSAGLESKVGARDNYITGGYGVLPSIRHGLNDVLDHDRRWPLDSPEGRRRLQQALEP